MHAFVVILLLLFALPAERSSVPLGLEAYRPVPETNPLTPEKIALGRRLFFDSRLARDAFCGGLISRVRSGAGWSNGHQLSVSRPGDGRRGVLRAPTSLSVVRARRASLRCRAIRWRHR